MKKLFFIFGVLLLVSCGGGGGAGSASSHSALCNDGTYSDSKSCSGTCSSHGGVKEWYNQCGNSASMLSLSFGSEEAPEQKTGIWVGKWINKQNDVSGTMRLNITEDGLIDALLYNKDNTVNSAIHSHVDDNGTVKLFGDVKETLTDSIVEYPIDISLNILGSQLNGSINIQKNANEEKREIELYRE